MAALPESAVAALRAEVAALPEAVLAFHPAPGQGDLLQEWVHHDRNHLRQVLANVQAYVWPAMGNARKFSAP